MRTRDTKGILDNGFIIFFLGPLLFFLVALIAGNGLLSDESEKKNGRFAWLISAGGMFYFVLLILLVSSSL